MLRRVFTNLKIVRHQGNSWNIIGALSKCYCTPAASNFFKDCRSLDEVLLVFNEKKSHETSDILGALTAMNRIQRSTLRLNPWAITEDEIRLATQAAVNSEIQVWYKSLHNNILFDGVLRTIADHLPSDADNTAFIFHELAKLYVVPYHPVMTLLDCQSREMLDSMSLQALLALSDVANYLRRNGFLVNGLIAGQLKMRFNSLDTSPQTFCVISDILYSISYFCSTDFLLQIIKWATYSCDAFSDSVPTKNLISFVADNGRMLPPTYHHNLRPFLEAVEKRTSELSCHDSSKIARFIIECSDPSEHTVFLEKVKDRCLELYHKGLLRAPDVVSLASVFDCVGWDPEIRYQFLNSILPLHLPDFDVLLIKHFSNSDLLRVQGSSLVEDYSRIVINRLSDIVRTVSALVSVVLFYTRCYKPPKYIVSALEECIVEEIRNGFLAVNFEKSFVCCRFLLRHGSEQAASLALQIINNYKVQMRPIHYLHALQSIQRRKTFMEKRNMPYAWYDAIIEQKDQIRAAWFAANLIRYMFPRDVPMGESDARLWSSTLEELAHTIHNKGIHSILLTISAHNIFTPIVLDVIGDKLSRDASLAHLGVTYLTTCAKLNYFPKSFSLHPDKIVAAQIMPMNALRMLQFCSALSILDLHCDWVADQVFNVDFLHHVDDTMSDVAEFGGSESIDGVLYDINRAIVLQHPELCVPWIKPRLQWLADRRNNKEINGQISIALQRLLGDAKYIRQNVQSEYGYFIDFEFLVSDEFGPVSLDDLRRIKSSVKRFALLTLSKFDYCVNEMHLLGRPAAKLRHLEILGYTLILLQEKQVEHYADDVYALENYLHHKIFNTTLSTQKYINEGQIVYEDVPLDRAASATFA